MQTQRSRVYELLLRLANTGDFREVTYGEDGICLGKIICPKSASCDEKTGEWGTSTNGRSLNRDRTQWTWSLILSFTCPVDASLFEQSITQPVIYLHHVDPVPGQPALRSLRVELESADYSHPPRSQPTNGSKITYTLTARETHR